MKPKVFVTRRINDKTIQKLESVFNVEMWPEEEIPVPTHILEDKITDADALFCLLTETIDEDLILKAKKLKVISNMAVGYNNIDIEAAKKQGISVTNTPGVLTETTADLTFALLLSTARRIAESSSYLKSGKWKTWSPMQLTGQDVHGATLGIVGMGRIGEAVARRAKGFNMNILYHNRSRKPDAESELDAQYTDLETLLKESDFICVMTPCTKETYQLFSTEQFKLMKPTAVLINTSRGGVVDELALYEALVNEEIWAAGLDVYELEPISINHPLLRLDNVIALPHIGSASIQTRNKMADVAADNLIQAFKNNPINVVV